MLELSSITQNICLSLIVFATLIEFGDGEDDHSPYSMILHYNVRKLVSQEHAVSYYLIIQNETL